MALQDEIDIAAKQIKTDAYSMSIGELLNLYNDNEIDIHPEFQRFYRWTSQQKTRLIESILLGIPLPPIFVAQRRDGVWDVVDGLQRLSTILELVGVLKREDGTTYDPLVLEATKQLPSLKGRQWKDSDDTRSLSEAQRLFVKRSKLDMKIVLKDSTETSKYELFQRLNTGGSPLSSQEVRNCVLVMLNRSAYAWLKELSDDPNFKECVGLTERAMEEQYHLELVLRFMIFRTIPNGDTAGIGDMSTFLDDAAVRVAATSQSQLDIEKTVFQRTFRLLAETVGADAFRRHESGRNRFVGGFLISCFEVVAMGMGHHSATWEQHEQAGTAAQLIPDILRKVWQDPEFVGTARSGVRASQRVPKTIPVGRRLFG